MSGIIGVVYEVKYEVGKLVDKCIIIYGIIDNLLVLYGVYNLIEW